MRVGCGFKAFFIAVKAVFFCKTRFEASIEPRVSNLLTLFFRFVFFVLPVSFGLLVAPVVWSSVAKAVSLCSDSIHPQSAAIWLHQRDGGLHTSPLVTRATRLHPSAGSQLEKPINKINHWLKYLEQMASKASKSAATTRTIKEVLYKEFIIKPTEIADSYFDFQVRLARERGEGDIKLTEEQKQQLRLTVIEGQKKSLDSWIEYFISKDTAIYPMWIEVPRGAKYRMVHSG